MPRTVCVKELASQMVLERYFNPWIILRIARAYGEGIDLQVEVSIAFIPYRVDGLMTLKIRLASKNHS